MAYDLPSCSQILLLMIVLPLLSQHLNAKSLRSDTTPAVQLATSTAFYCANGGFYLPSEGRCFCQAHYDGDHCEQIDCGDHGIVVKHSYRLFAGGSATPRCKCNAHYVGQFCDKRCLNGNWEDGRCNCFEDYGSLDCSRSNFEKSTNVILGIALCASFLLMTMFICVMITRCIHSQRIQRERASLASLTQLERVLQNLRHANNDSQGTLTTNPTAAPQPPPSYLDSFAFPKYYAANTPSSARSSTRSQRLPSYAQALANAASTQLHIMKSTISDDHPQNCVANDVDMVDNQSTEPVDSLQQSDGENKQIERETIAVLNHIQSADVRHCCYDIAGDNKVNAVSTAKKQKTDPSGNINAAFKADSTDSLHESNEICSVLVV